MRLSEEASSVSEQHTVSSRVGGETNRQVTTTPNLFIGDGRVRRIDGTDRSHIQHLFEANDGTSALICGNTDTVLSTLPDCVFQSCITSPPYWSLRDYNIPGQIGLESSVSAYIDHLTE